MYLCISERHYFCNAYFPLGMEVSVCPGPYKSICSSSHAGNRNRGSRSKCSRQKPAKWSLLFPAGCLINLADVGRSSCENAIDHPKSHPSWLASCFAFNGHISVVRTGMNPHHSILERDRVVSPAFPISASPSLSRGRSSHHLPSPVICADPNPKK